MLPIFPVLSAARGIGLWRWSGVPDRDPRTPTETAPETHEEGIEPPSHAYVGSFCVEAFNQWMIAMLKRPNPAFLGDALGILPRLLLRHGQGRCSHAFAIASSPLPSLLFSRQVSPSFPILPFSLFFRRVCLSAVGFGDENFKVRPTE